MRNLLMAAILTIVGFGTLNAQTKTLNVTAVETSEINYKPGAGSFTLEVGFSPFNTSNETISLSGGEIKGIYSITDNFGVRLGLGFSKVSSSVEREDANDDLDKEANSLSEFSLSPGIVYSFNGTSRLTPYVGLDLNFATAGDKVTYDYETLDTDGVTKNGTVGYNAFGVNIFSGFNYYFAKNLYIGAEIGFGIASAKDKDVYVEIDGEDVSTKRQPQSKATVATVFSAPTLRLGWTF